MAVGERPSRPARAAFERRSARTGDTLYIVDQRRLPGEIVEYPCRSAGEVAFAIRSMVVRGAPAIGQVAAIGLALSAEKLRDGRPYARRATLRGSANALTNARPTVRNIGWAVERVMARYAEVGELAEDGDAIAEAIRAETDAIIFEATTDHGRMASFGARHPAGLRRSSAADPDPRHDGHAGGRPVSARRSGSSRPPTTPAATSTSGSTRRDRRSPGRA